MLRGYGAQGPGRAARGMRSQRICSITTVDSMNISSMCACAMHAYRAPHTRPQVRCCADVQLSPAWGAPRPGCSVWGESDAGWPCTRDKTFAEAEAICRSVGARLCTAAELVDGCTAGTGCQFDFELIWGTTPPAHPRRRRRRTRPTTTTIPTAPRSRNAKRNAAIPRASTAYAAA